MNARLRLLFVDDEGKILDGLRRMLRPMREQWDMRFCESGEAALVELAAVPADVVVSDMRMPGMNGAELLTAVMRRWPSTVRLVLSGHADLELVHRTVGPTHQYLQKPCDADTLKATVARAAKLRMLLTNDRLRSLAGRMDSIPCLPALYLQIVELLQKPGATTEQVGVLVAQDLGMTARILQVVNSAFFGLRREVTGVQEAVGLLGIDTIQALVLSVQAFAAFDAKDFHGISPDDLWRHSMAVADIARRISAHEHSLPPRVDASFMAGMLHDAGKLVLAANLPEDYAKAVTLARERGIPIHVAEQEVLGATHAEVGAYLLGLWGISDPIVEAVAWHHQPLASLHREFSPLTAVHVANGLHHAVAGDPRIRRLDAPDLNDRGLGPHLGAWARIATAVCAGGTERTTG